MLTALRTVTFAAALAALALVAAPRDARSLAASCQHFFSFSSQSYGVAEGDAVTLTVTEQVTPPSGMATCGSGSVSYATSDGSAKAPADYAATSGTLTFDALPSGGQHTKTFTVQTAANGTA